MTINISPELTERLQTRLNESTEFTSIDAYVEYILTEVLNQTEGTHDTDSSAYSAKEEEEVKQRLSDLGYLD